MNFAAVAMSGGVDSAVCALFLKEQGYKVEGITFRLTGEDDGNIADAYSVCQALGINHRVYDYRALFQREVIAPFIKGYLEGITPNPCVFCNRSVKFGRFLQQTMEEGFDFAATGHYAQVEKDGNRYRLLRAKNLEKDQSYVLYQLGQSELARIKLPLGAGDSTKEELRQLLREKNISVANRPDSQDICFIPTGDHAAFIEERGGKSNQGNFIDVNGRILGPHKGCYRYTLGQRKGLGIALGAPAFVESIDIKSGDIVLTTQEERLFTTKVRVKNTTFCSGEVATPPFECEVRLRYSQKCQPALATPLEGNKMLIELESPSRAPTPGQSAVLYNGEEVLGGGIIE